MSGPVADGQAVQPEYKTDIARLPEDNAKREPG